MSIWKKYTEEKPPIEMKEFLVVTSNHIIPIIEVVRKVSCRNTYYTITASGRIIDKESILYWTELPEFNEEFPVDIETIIFNSECKCK